MDEQTRPREIIRLLVRRIKDNLGRLNAARPNENLLLESDQYEDIQLRLPHINAALKPLIEDATELLRHPETAEGSWPGLRALASYEVGGPLLLMFWHREPIRYIIAYELCRLNTGYHRGKPVLAANAGDTGKAPDQSGLADPVTLKQISDYAKVSKRTLEEALRDGKMPKPAKRGGKGRAHFFNWPDVLPYLRTVSPRILPDKFPGNV